MNASLLTVVTCIRIMQASFYILVDMTSVITQQNRLHANAVTKFKTFSYLSFMCLTLSNINK